MRRFFGLVVLAGLLLSFGCGKDNKVETPKDIPPVPKERPGVKGAPGGTQDKGRTAQPVSP